MKPVSDAFLLNIAEVSASLIGLFLVGVFFYVETGLRRVGEGREEFERYLRSGIRITLIVLAFPVGLSLTLVALEPIWSRVLFWILSVVLVVANYDSVARLIPMWKVTHSTAFLVNEIVTTLVALTMLGVPWALGGWNPSREDLTWSILLAFAAGFLSIVATVMSAFDMGRLERGE